MRPFQCSDVSEIQILRAGELLSEKGRKRRANMMQVARARWMRTQKLHRQLPKIVRAAEPLDHREAERQRLDEPFAQVVPIDVEPSLGAQPIFTNVRLNGIRFIEHRSDELQLQLTQRGHDAPPACDRL